MAKVVIDLSQINLNIKDKNMKYLFYRIVDTSRNSFSDSSINCKIKVSSNEIPSDYITNIVDALRNAGT